MPPPLQKAPETRQQPMKPNKPPSRKRVTFQLSQEEDTTGMTDEDIQAFLRTRSKRGRGSIGPQVDKPSPTTTTTTAAAATSTSFSRSRTSSYRQTSRWDRGGGSGGILGSRGRENVWSRVTMATTTPTTTTTKPVAEVPKLWNPVDAWRNGVKKDHHT
ncbi:hypothetical protein LINPERHAP2_LOCUS27106 [Linum perenne]